MFCFFDGGGRKSFLAFIFQNYFGKTFEIFPNCMVIFHLCFGYAQFLGRVFVVVIKGGSGSRNCWGTVYLMIGNKMCFFGATPWASGLFFFFFRFDGCRRQKLGHKPSLNRVAGHIFLAGLRSFVFGDKVHGYQSCEGREIL